MLGMRRASEHEDPAVPGGQDLVAEVVEGGSCWSDATGPHTHMFMLSFDRGFEQDLQQ